MYLFRTEFMHKSILDFLNWNSWLDCHVVMQGIHDSPCINSSYFKHEVHDNSCTNSLYLSSSVCVNSCSDSCMSSSMNPNIYIYIYIYYSNFILTAVLNQRPCRCICTVDVAAAGRKEGQPSPSVLLICLTVISSLNHWDATDITGRPWTPLGAQTVMGISIDIGLKGSVSRLFTP